MKQVSILALFVALGCSTPSSVQPVSVPLQYKMMVSPAEFPTLPACAAVSAAKVIDGRSDRNLGKRFVEGKSSPAAEVTTTSDVAAWVKESIDKTLERSGVKVGDPAAPLLEVSIEQISTSENVLHRSGYEGRIVLAARLRKSGMDADCWRARVEGFSQNYGYSGSIENYQETLNHALDRAIIRLLDSPEAKAGMCGKCAGN